MSNFVFDNISIFIVLLLLFGFVVLLMSSEDNLNFLFTKSSGKFILLSILIICSSYNYWIGILLVIIFILMNSYINNVSNIINENQTTKPLYSGLFPSNYQLSIGSEPFVNKTTTDSNILDRERSMTKDSNSLPINKNKSENNTLANEPGKEGFQSEYTNFN
jgi:hypothetical protein